MREQLDYFFELSFVLVLWNFKTVFTQNIVTIGCKDFRHREFTNFKVDEGLETLLSHNREMGVIAEAIPDYFEIFILHTEQLVNNLT